MKSPNQNHLRELLDRIARVSAAAEWTDKLNPAQRSALSYLARANKFSRTPSNVADYLCTTRGTASQTLKTLEAKHLVVPIRSASDKRSISYDVTAAGRSILGTESEFDQSLQGLTAKNSKALQASLEAVLGDVLARRGFRSFGVCKTCRYHKTTPKGRECELLKLSLAESDAGELCHEHVSVN